jgi:hypothetical protein
MKEKFFKELWHGLYKMLLLTVVLVGGTAATLYLMHLIEPNVFSHGSQFGEMNPIPAMAGIPPLILAYWLGLLNDKKKK